MQLRERMIEVLRGQEARKIKFTFTGTTGLDISFDGSRNFRLVARAVEENRIRLDTKKLAEGWAKYDSLGNIFSIGPNDQRDRRAFDALLIHESVHAAFDLNRSRLPWLDNETAAYIAQGFYLYNSGYDRNRLDKKGEPYMGVLLVDSIIRDGTPDVSLIQKLHRRLVSNPQYQNYIRRTFSGNG